MGLRSHDLRTRLGWVCTCFWLLVASFGVSLAHADFCSEYVVMSDHDAEQLAASLGGEGSMARLLTRLESMDGCTILQRVNQQLDMGFVEHRRLRAALLVVATIGRGATTDSDAVTAASTLAAGLQFDSDRRALRAYITDKLVLQPGREPLAALVEGHIAEHELQALAAGVTTTVAAGRWQPPGNQPGWFYVGNQAHRAIGRNYSDANSMYAVRLNDKPISSILIELAESGIGSDLNRHAKAVGALALRPDIVNLDTLEIYEIKPAGAQAAAVAQVAQYIAAFASAGVTLVPGRPDAPGTSGVLPAPNGHYRFHAPQAGVIAYEYRHGDYAPALVPGEAASREQADERRPVTTQLMVTARPLHIGKSMLEKYRDHMAATTGLSGAALVAYVVVSEGSRAFLPRNALPVP